MRSLKQTFIRHWLRSHAMFAATAVVVVGLVVYVAAR